MGVDERIGVYVCHCGTNIADTVDIGELSAFAGELDGVALVRDCAFELCDLILRDVPVIEPLTGRLQQRARPPLDVFIRVGTHSLGVVQCIQVFP